jgi:hypothetical protein
MERARLRTRPRLSLQRHFERSRLEEHLVTAAYERAAPLRRQPVPAPRSPHRDKSPDCPSPVTSGGLSA